MTKKLILEVENFNPIKHAHMDIRKINIIGGINASGKSTLSKFLFCFLTSISDEGKYIANQNVKNSFSRFIMYWSGNYILNNSEIGYDETSKYEQLNNIITQWDNNNSSINYFLEKYTTLKNIIDNSDLRNNDRCIEDLKTIKDTIENYKDITSRYVRVTNTLLRSEYDSSQLGTFKDAKVKLNGINNKCEFEEHIDFKETSLITELNKDFINCFNFHEICYVDSPSIFDMNPKLSSNNNTIPDKIPYHYNFLYKCLTNSKINVLDEVYDEKSLSIEEDIKKLIDGEFDYYPSEDKFLYHSNGKYYEMKNTASGYKQIGIIQLLIKNRMLSKDSFLILDEPEINLHPLLQVKFAEILVKISKELNIILYINSHSPQFIEALEVYSARYDLRDETMFYLTERDNDKLFRYINVKRADLYELYNNLGDPYDIIDEVRAENINNNIFDDVE